MPEIINVWISEYGYFAIFIIFSIGILGWWVPDEAILAYAGCLAFQGKLNLTVTLVVAVVSCCIGITLSYALGRWLGLPLVLRYGKHIRLTESRLAWCHGWLQRRGRWVLVFTYFVPGLRHLTALVAGMAKVEVPLFGLYSYSAATVWSIAFLGAGYVLGQQWHVLERNRWPILLGLAVVVAIALAASIVIRRAMKLAAARAPRPWMALSKQLAEQEADAK